jgi:glycosyltransferase involved in cell wall biosynthesis
MLDRLFTDICAVKGWPRLLSWLPRTLRRGNLGRLASRVPAGLPPRLITAFAGFGLRYAAHLRAARSPREQTAAFLWAGKTFCELILKAGLGPGAGVYTFNSAGLELLQHARERGLPAVMEQTILPKAVEQRILSDERARWPGWEETEAESETDRLFAAREAAEWETAEVIVCGSEHDVEGLRECGGPAEKCVVVPRGIDGEVFSPAERSGPFGPLRVLTVGTVGLRKGTPYVLESARRLKGVAQFRVAGSVNVLPEAATELRRHLTLLGPVPRSQVKALYDWAHVLLLPSLCEGSATVTYEALACGLPVVCTPNAGSIVRDGVDGFLVPARDAGAIAGRLEMLAASPALWQALSRNARERAAFGSVKAYAGRLLQALHGQAIPNGALS